MIDGFTLGAYAAEPRNRVPRGDAERRWFEALAAIEGARGLEVFFRGGVQPGGPEHLAGLLPEEWHLVITALPQAVAGSADDPRYGLASTHPDGRRAAVRHIRQLLAEAHRIDAERGERVVRAVEVHSAPRALYGVAAGPEELALSLRELADAAGGIPLIVEHCDALAPGQASVKGYLPIEHEYEAVQAARADGIAAGQSINWGRSAIEGRSGATPSAHLRWLVERRALSGLIFSGAPAADGRLGPAWDDLHNPLREDDPSSLLDAEAVRDSLAALGDGVTELLFLGAKVQDPQDSQEHARRLAPLIRTIGAIRAGMEET